MLLIVFPQMLLTVLLMVLLTLRLLLSMILRASVPAYVGDDTVVAVDCITILLGRKAMDIQVTISQCTH